MKVAVALALAAPLVSAQQSMWGQCGGIGWTGATSCVAGAACTTLNPYYAQCLSASGQTTTTTTSRTTTPVIITTTSTTTSRTTTTSSTTTRTTTGTNPVGTGLHARIRAKGKRYFGFCADPAALNDGRVTNILRAESNQLTNENSMKWESIHPSENSYNWGSADTVVNWALSNNQIMRGHTFVWHAQLPQWVRNINNKATLTTVIQNHIAAVGGRYRGKIDSWDVANEVFEDNGSRRASVFSNVFGDWTFLDVAFRAARAADPAAKLCLNDYNLDYQSAKLTNFVQLVKDLKARGVPIDCVGTQSHLIVGNGAIPSYKTTLDSLASTQLEVQITELDIRTNTPASSSALAQQATDYRNVVAACMNTPLCSGITMWGISDGQSWIPYTFPGQGAALLWDANFVKKSAYNAVIGAIGT